MSDLASKMYLYGIGCLLSMNYLQSGIFQVIFAYLIMIVVVLVLLLSISKYLDWVGTEPTMSRLTDHLVYHCAIL